MRPISGWCDVEKVQHWNSRGHFFAAAAEAMRRILVENARRKKSVKAGGAMKRVDFENMPGIFDSAPDDLLAVDEALTKLEERRSTGGRRCETALVQRPNYRRERVQSRRPSRNRFSPLGLCAGIPATSTARSQVRIKFASSCD